MEKAEELKRMVRKTYGEIAESAGCGNSCCCGVTETAESDYTIFADDYTQLGGYNPDADLKLGCGMPTEHAKIKKGDTVVDLGSGAGNDAFVARAITGDAGRVIVPGWVEAAQGERISVNAQIDLITAAGSSRRKNAVTPSFVTVDIELPAPALVQRFRRGLHSFKFLAGAIELTAAERRLKKALSNKRLASKGFDGRCRKALRKLTKRTRRSPGRAGKV